MFRIVYLFFISVLFLGCFSNSTSQNVMKPSQVFKLNIPEPSGITFKNNHLYIVSDYNGMVYKTTFKGNILDKIQVSTTNNEGVSFNSKGNLVVVNESKRRLVEIDKELQKEKTFKIKGKQKHNNSGLEGVCFVPSEKAYFLLNEKSPKQLLKISLKGKLKDEIKINFCNDLSGICFDEDSNSFWLVSDESQLLMNVSLKGKLLKSYKIPVLKAEGVTVANNKIYIVSDAESKLYVFSKPNLLLN